MNIYICERTAPAVANNRMRKSSRGLFCVNVLHVKQLYWKRLELSQFFSSLFCYLSIIAADGGV